MRVALVRLALGTMVGMAALAACGSADDGYDPSVPTAMELVSGENQEGIVGEVLPEPLVVVVTNLKGDPVANVSVQWSVITGGGRVTSATTTTDADGLAQVTFILGNVVGNQLAQAITGLSGSPVSFNATAAAAPPPEEPGGGGAVRQP